MTTKKLDLIQAARGIAAMMVVVCHFQFFLRADHVPQMLSNLMNGFSSGVDIFFMISGFIITVSTAGNAATFQSAASFLAKRAMRVVPTYYFWTLFFAFCFAAGGGSAYVSDAASRAVLMHSLMFWPDRTVSAPMLGFPTLIQGWTLNYEMYFYLVFGLSLMFGRMRWVAFFSWMALTLAVIPAMHGQLTWNPYIPNFARTSGMALITNPLILEFVTGVLMGFLYLSQIKIRNTWIPGGVTLICGIALIAQLATNARGGYGLSGWAILPAVMLFCVILMEKTERVFVPRSLVWLGNISYSLYLTHTIALAAMDALWRVYGTDARNGGISVWAICLAISLFVSSLSHRFIERRAPRLFSRDKGTDTSGQLTASRSR